MSAVIGLVAAMVVKSVVGAVGARLVRDSLKRQREHSDSGAGDKAIGMTTLTTDAPPLRSASQIRQEYKPIQTLFPAGTNVADAKDKVLADLADRPFYANDATELQAIIDELQNATSLSEIRSLGNDLVSSVENANQRVFAETTKIACQNAAVKTGFTKLERLANPLRSDVIRFAATNDRGVTIVTEIDTTLNRNVKIDAEVLGLNDNTCHDVLDRFHAALKAEGVVIATPPRKAATGGICALRAAKDFLAVQLKPNTANAMPLTAADTSNARTIRTSNKKKRARLNPSTKIKIKS